MKPIIRKAQMHPANTGEQQATRSQFKPGQSGNPKGRPQGSRHKTSLAVMALLEGEAEESHQEGSGKGPSR
jgi:hypothetical protein